MFRCGLVRNPANPANPAEKGGWFAWLKVVPKSGKLLGLSENLSTTTPNIFQCWEVSGLCLNFCLRVVFAVLVNILKNQSNNMRIFEYVFLYGGCLVVGVCYLVFLWGWLIIDAKIILCYLIRLWLVNIRSNILKDS